MNFRFHGVSPEGFDQWAAKVRAEQGRLDRAAYLDLEKPSEAVPVRYYGSVEDGMFGAILGMCVRPGQMCVHEMHHIDRSGGAGRDSEANRERLDYDNRRLESGTEAPGATFPASGRPPQGSVQPEGMKPRDQNLTRGGVNQPQPEPDQGQGNAVPGADRGSAPAQLNSQPTESHQH
jgi:cytochrome o ubiquinol oxidase subunit 2